MANGKAMRDGLWPCRLQWSAAMYVVHKLPRAVGFSATRTTACTDPDASIWMAILFLAWFMSAKRCKRGRRLARGTDNGAEWMRASIGTTVVSLGWCVLAKRCVEDRGASLPMALAPS